jgi:hypothetical protein
MAVLQMAQPVGAVAARVVAGWVHQTGKPIPVVGDAALKVPASVVVAAAPEASPRHGSLAPMCRMEA